MRYFIVTMLIAVLPGSSLGQDSTRPRARDLGLAIGIFNTGEHNAITDVPGVHVGHTTVPVSYTHLTLPTIYSV